MRKLSICEVALMQAFESKGPPDCEGKDDEFALHWGSDFQATSSLSLLVSQSSG